jgi:hypothetical protein
MDVLQRNGENQTPQQHAWPARPGSSGASRTPAHDVVAVVDGLEQRLHMGRRPRFLSRRHEDQGQVRSLESSLQGTGEVRPFDLDDALLDRPTQPGEVIHQGCDDRFRSVVGQVGEQDDPNAGARERIAPEVVGEGIVEFLARRHSNSRGRRANPSDQTVWGWPASQRSTSRP